MSNSLNKPRNLFNAVIDLENVVHTGFLNEEFLIPKFLLMLMLYTS